MSQPEAQARCSGSPDLSALGRSAPQHRESLAITQGSRTGFPARERISLCMIVRNEERCLERCLRSAAPWVSEIVVVDTGSTDRTIAIAESFGAMVVPFAWCDDFSAARNVSLEAATREWALVLDADDELVVVDPDEFGRAVEQTVIDGFSFQYRSCMDDGQISVAPVFRLFRRNLPRMRYRGFVHEQVAAVSDGQATTAALACFHILHDGYTSHVAHSTGKKDRNVRLARKQVEATPGDPFAWYCLGLSLPETNFDEMAAAYEQALSLLANAGRPLAGEPYIVSMYLRLFAAYQGLEANEKAAKLLDQALAIFPHSPDLRFHRGQLLAAAGELSAAVADYEACLMPAARDFFFIAHPATMSYAARTYLAAACLDLGRHAEAEGLLEQALAESPAAFALPRRLAGMMKLQRGEWSGARGLLQQAFTVEPDDATRFHLGWSLYMLEAYDEAERILLPLAERPEVQQLLGKVYLDWGKGAPALSLLGDCPLPSAGLALGWAAYVTGDPPRAAEAWNHWLRAGAADWGTKDTLSTFLFLLQGGRRPSGQPERPAEPLRDMDQWFRLLLRYECFDDVERAITRGPDLGDRLWLPLRKKWAVTLASEGYFDAAIPLLLDARAADEADADVYYWLGVCAHQRQQPDEAAVLWQSCLTLAPAHRDAVRALAGLRVPGENAHA